MDLDTIDAMLGYVALVAGERDPLGALRDLLLDERLEATR